MTYLRPITLTAKIATGSVGLLLVALLSSTAIAQADETIFSASGDSVWRLYLGSSSNWMVPVQGDVTTSHKSKVVTVSRIDNAAQADAIQAVWKNGLGQVYWQQDEAQDYRELTEQGGALSMVIRIDKAPKKGVDVKMDCGYPCAGSLDMTKLFKTVPKDQWFRISLKLSCFKEAGANMSNILAPLVIATSGSFRMSIADVRLMENAPKESLLDCG
jgi:beta-glucosidase